MDKTNQSSTKDRGWAQFCVTWTIAAVAAVLIAFGATNLVKTIYKNTLPKYPVDSFRYPDFSLPPQPVTSDGKETKPPELTEEEKQKANDRETEQRSLAKINDYASSFGQLLAGLGLSVVFGLIRRTKE